MPRDRRKTTKSIPVQFTQNQDCQPLLIFPEVFNWMLATEDPVLHIGLYVVLAELCKRQEKRRFSYLSLSKKVKREPAEVKDAIETFTKAGIFKIAKNEYGKIIKIEHFEFKSGLPPPISPEELALTLGREKKKRLKMENK
jgi:hypothetical protein